MNQSNQLQTAESRQPGAIVPQAANVGAISPPVDIFEDANGITLLADLPGVSREQLDVRVESGHLLIEGHINNPVPDHLSVVYAEVRGAIYRRSFTLSNELDSAGVEANLKDGVLTVRVPRTEAAKPRRIEVKVG
jgi:HSP20 family molecular chaperone IbpA